jgi:hypothetical protein
MTSFDNDQVKHAPGMFQDCRGQSGLINFAKLSRYSG